MGGGVVDNLRRLNHDPIEVNFGSKPDDERKYANKRAEMWKLTRDWLKEGGAIPEDPVLHADLIGPETVGRLDGKLLIEPKDAMKKRGLASPNRADALALSFAYPVSSKRTSNSGARSGGRARIDEEEYA